MNIRDLKPASKLSVNYGVKAIVYGQPGSGKTPIAATAPRPVMCVCEPGMLSMRKYDSLPCWEAYTTARIDEFFKWIQTKEASAFDTIVIDSISQMAEIALGEALAANKHGMKAYGEMSRYVMDKLTQLYYMPQKHTYLIAKQGLFEEEGTTIKKPYFPGKELNVQVPHMYDEVLHVGTATINGQNVKAIRSWPTFGIFARDRSGMLAEYEPCDLTHIFKKIGY